MSYPPVKSPRGPADVSAKVPADRRDRLLNIKKREELKDMLLYKFKHKYGDGQSTAIGKEVGKFCQDAAVTPNNLARLERRVQQVKHPRADDQRSDVSAYSARSARTPRGVATPRSQLSARGEQVAQSQLASQLQSQLSARGSAMTPVRESAEGSDLAYRDFDWAKLDQYASYLHEQDSQRQKVGTTEMQKKMKTDLDKQVADARRKKHRLHEENQKYFTHQVAEIEVWKELEEAKKQSVLAKNYKEKADRDEQLRHQKLRRDAEFEQQQTEEKALVSKIRQEMDHEKVVMNERKEQQRLAMLKIMEDNLADRKVKDAQREEQLQMEIEGMREYNRILDAQEAARAAELDARVTRQKELMEKMKESVFDVQGAKDKADALRAEQQKQASDAKAESDANAKAEKLKQLRLDTQDFLFRQMLEKEDRKEQAYELKRLQATILEQDSQAFETLERQKEQERRRVNVAHRQELDAQIERKRREKEYVMSDAEVKMNKRLLKVVNQTLEGRDEQASAAA
jgi:hypothetical protein